MQPKVKAIVLGVMTLGFLLSANSATALVAGELQQLRIVSHHFTTSISTGQRQISTTDAAKGRYLVLKLATISSKHATPLFAADFVLVYAHQDGREDRAACDAISTADTATPGELGTFHAGSVPRITVSRGEVYFGLAFWIEPDVSTIELHRIGAVPVTYRIGDTRPYSVFLSTNLDSSLLADAKRVIQAGDYNVIGTSNRLAKEETKTVINYAELAEVQAREISQRLRLKLGVAPTLKKMELVSEVDIVVWLGAEPSHPQTPQVRQLQERLKAAGFPPGPIDGSLGSQTKTALRQYQEAHGLPLTGEPDEATLHALGIR